MDSVKEHSDENQNYQLYQARQDIARQQRAVLMEIEEVRQEKLVALQREAVALQREALALQREAVTLQEKQAALQEIERLKALLAEKPNNSAG
jgi:FtsZ-binding cell division protein ZapB